MGCVSSKGFEKGPDRASTCYMPVSQNGFISDEDWDAGHVHAVSFSSISSEKFTDACFLNRGTKIKLWKSLSRKKLFTVMPHSNEERISTYGHTERRMQSEEGNSPLTYASEHDRFAMRHHAEDEREHFLMSHYLQTQPTEMHIGRTGSWIEGEDDNAQMWGSADLKDFRANLKGLRLQKDSLSASKDVFAPQTKVSRAESPLQPDAEIINMQEIMEGLEDNIQTPYSRRSQEWATLTVPNRDISFYSVSDFPIAAHGDNYVGSPVWKKYYMPDNCPSGRHFSSPASGSPFDESPRLAPLFPVPFSHLEIEHFDANAIGLKILLSPSNSSFHPSPVNRAHSVVSNAAGEMHGQCVLDAMRAKNMAELPDLLFGNVGSPHRSQKEMKESVVGLADHDNAVNDVKTPGNSMRNTRRSSRSSMEVDNGSGSPLFDPSLMATFEEALKASMDVNPNDNRFSDDSPKMSSLAGTCYWLGTSVKLESTQAEQTTGKQVSGRELYSKMALSSYEIRCPPRGKDKVVLYFTSLRCVRKTFEDCCDIRLILRGLGVQVDERDVWMHSEFRSELKHILDGLFRLVPQVPQLFIKGRYIGGVDTVKQLHEDGLLLVLMDGLPNALTHSVCKGCGDARFIPCFTCHGSRKVLNVANEVTQCLACNENGLTMCPICIM